jgi:hypothetical protein
MADKMEELKFIFDPFEKNSLLQQEIGLGFSEAIESEFTELESLLNQSKNHEACKAT